jgi:hypothetical protein
MVYRYYTAIFSIGPVCHNSSIVPVYLALINLVTGMHEGSMLPSVKT